MPEIFIGFVAPIGVDLRPSLRAFENYFANNDYNVIEIKVTDVFEKFATKLTPTAALQSSPRYERFITYIKYGDQIRTHFDDDRILAATTCVRIMNRRTTKGKSKPEGNVYLLQQFKRKEEIELLRHVYGRVFFQASVYSRRGARVDYLARDFAQAVNIANPNIYRKNAEEIVQVDENEVSDAHGQQVSAIFHDADIIINSDVNEYPVEDQVARFCDLLFGSNKISPTKDEYGMFAAKAAALRTIDLSRQVGAAIFTEDGEIISMGSNEVPKAGGGTYWCDTKGHFDDRDYVREYDSNDRRKTQILTEILELAGLPNPKDVLASAEIKKSQFMDALEYGRIIHAEMSAICDAARLGTSVRDATLFCTTFPCHMCAKHIVAAGIRRVVFLEPYPKSLTAELHGDSVMIEGSDRGRYSGYPCVEFIHFCGISPRRYREMFERIGRKDGNGKFLPWKDNIQQPIIDLKFPFYTELEQKVFEFTKNYLDPMGLSIDEIAVI
ncbi:MAG TPA: anti-phage dCTP deaminase [Xanthobacteraceae bacterium]|nr:anti-phage dCTP deaminase [Xanthobacteraceae bacterium]